MNSLKHNKIENLKTKLINNIKTIIIAVENFNDIPQIGYAPFIFKNGSFYIFSSELSPHIKLLLKKERANFMIIQDENESKNIWTRIRIKFNGKTIRLTRENAIFNIICNDIEKKHGKTMSLIKTFADFHLIKIKPVEGVLVTGFGNAYSLKGQSLVIKNKIGN